MLRVVVLRVFARVARPQMAVRVAVRDALGWGGNVVLAVGIAYGFGDEAGEEGKGVAVAVLDVGNPKLGGRFGEAVGRAVEDALYPAQAAEEMREDVREAFSAVSVEIV